MKIAHMGSKIKEVYFVQGYTKIDGIQINKIAEQGSQCEFHVIFKYPENDRNEATDLFISQFKSDVPPTDTMGPIILVYKGDSIRQAIVKLFTLNQISSDEYYILLSLTKQHEANLSYKKTARNGFTNQQMDFLKELFLEQLKAIIDSTKDINEAVHLCSIVLHRDSRQPVNEIDITAVGSEIKDDVIHLLKLMNGDANVASTYSRLYTSIPDLKAQRDLFISCAINEIMRKFSDISLIDRFFMMLVLKAYSKHTSYALPGYAKEKLIQDAPDPYKHKPSNLIFAANLSSLIFEVGVKFEKSELETLKDSFNECGMYFFAEQLTLLFNLKNKDQQNSASSSSSAIPANNNANNPVNGPLLTQCSLTTFSASAAAAASAVNINANNTTHNQQQRHG